MPGKKKTRPFEESWALLVEERFLIIVTTFLVKNSKTPAVKIMKTVAFEGFVHKFLCSHCLKQKETSRCEKKKGSGDS